MLAEVVVAKEAATLLRRNPAKYIRGVAGMYLMSFYGLELGNTFRSAYYFVRHIDDVLDGDRQITSGPLAYVQDLRLQVETGNFKNGLTIATLARNAVVNLEKRAKSGDNPRADFLDAIDAIIFDYLRSKDRRTLTGFELEQYYHSAFDPVVNLTLMIVNSSLRSKDIPAMSYGQGRIYSVRDLDQDWERGTINIPQEILTQAGLTTSSKIEEVKSSGQIQGWFIEVLSTTKPQLQALQEQLKASSEKTTIFVLGGLITPMLRFIDRFVENPYDGI